MIDPGKMDRRILVQKSESVRQGSGQPVDVWVNTFTNGDGHIWAMKHTDRTAENYQADKKTASRNEVFVTRYFSEINERMTIVIDGLRYDITGIEEIGRRMGLHIKATWTDGQYND